MRAFFKVFIFITISIVYSACSNYFSSLNPFSSSTFEVKEGYLSLGKINDNIALQMPLHEKVLTDDIKIVSVKTFASAEKNKLIVEADFIFTSFEIPEGIPVIANFNSSLAYNPKSKEFRLANLKLINIKFLKPQLVEYISTKQKKFIKNTLERKLQEIVLHQSKKQFGVIESFETKDGKIKVKFK
jgi:hypothetical protein